MIVQARYGLRATQAIYWIAAVLPEFAMLKCVNGSVVVATVANESKCRTACEDSSETPIIDGTRIPHVQGTHCSSRFLKKFLSIIRAGR